MVWHQAPGAIETIRWSTAGTLRLSGFAEPVMNVLSRMGGFTS
jgi:hypothetical protein